MFCEEKEYSPMSENKMGICYRFGGQRKPLWGSSSKAEVKRIYRSQPDKELGCIFISQHRLSDAEVTASNSLWLITTKI